MHRRIASLDANSTAFRYARDRQSHTPDLPRGVLDLIRLHDVMNGIENFFECAELDFSHMEDVAAEMAQQGY